MTAGLALFLVFVLAVVCLVLAAMMMMPTKTDGEAFACFVFFGMGCAGVVAVAVRLLQASSGWPL